MTGGSSELRSRTIRRYLAERGFLEGSSELGRFLGARLRDLTPPDGMAGRAEACRRLCSAVRGKESIVVFGDYDCDGMTSTAILTEALRLLGAGRVTPIVASRFSGGYGLSGAALERVLQAEPKVVVTCDCGSSDHESLRRLREHGVDAIVVDHHLVPAEPLPALAFLNPHQPGCRFPYKGMASCGLVLNLVAALRTELGVELDLRRWLDLVAIGTIADVAPLSADNRALTRAGLQVLAEGKRPGLRALLEVIGLPPGARLLAGEVSFRIAPRLNAPGRLGPADIVVELLLSGDSDRALALATEVERLCSVRREDQERMLRAAEEEAQEHKGSPALVLGHEGWNHGIVGIVAGRLAAEHDVPTIVIGFENGVGRGSARGPAGFPLFDAIQACSEHLVRFGGHHAAAGLEIKLERLDEFREAFVTACGKMTGFTKVARPRPIELDPADALDDIFQDLALLEPCGEQNLRPVFQVDAEVRASRVVKGDHLKLDLRLPGGGAVSAFAPKLGSKARPVGSSVRVTFDIREDRYRGGGALELLLSDIAAL